MRRAALAVFLLAGCGDDTPAGGGAPPTGGAGGATTSSMGGGGSGAVEAGGGGAAGHGGQGGEPGGGYELQSAIVTSDHRFIDGQMFGGWGPHLGHMMRAGASAEGDLYFVDDICAQAAGGALAQCNVNVDHTLGYHRRDARGWSLIATASIPGTVQQNTATIVSADGSKLHTYGVDVAAGHIVECTFPLPSGPAACSALGFDLPADSNYVGAAITPDGYRMVWWTVVADGGGGSFHYIVDYGAGWNGPRSGPVAGYNDASYIDIAFPTNAPARFVMHAQLVSGLAPDWSFFGGIGEGDLTTADPVTWSLPLAAVNGDDPVASTNDIWIDPETQDEHVLGRTVAGRLAYYHRAPSGAWSPPLFVLDATYRARFVAHGDRLALVAGPNGGGLGFRVASALDRPPGEAIDWAGLAQESIALPEGYEDVYAIYPASPPYQRAAAGAIDVAIVAADRQYEILSVSLTPR